MSQYPAPIAAVSVAKLALAIAIIGLILGGGALAYVVYEAQTGGFASQGTGINVHPAVQRVIYVDWTNTDPTKLDRFFPNDITVFQGDNLTIIFSTNDTTDGHTFTIGLNVRGMTGAAQFQLNNSWIGQWSGPYTKVPFTNFTGPATGCSDQNGALLPACNVKNVNATATPNKIASSQCNSKLAALPNATGPPCNLWSIGVLQPTVAGTYQFHCYFHQKVGMIGYLIVLPNKGYPG